MENLHMQKVCCLPAKESDIILQPCRFMMQRAKKSRAASETAGRKRVSYDRKPDKCRKNPVCMCRKSRAGAIQTRSRDESARKRRKKKSAPLECMSNLTANEMFTKDGIKSAEEVVGEIVSEMQTLSQKLDNLVIVTNNVFEDGVIYDAGTMEYLKALGRINASACASGRPGGRGRGRNSGGAERMRL